MGPPMPCVEDYDISILVPGLSHVHQIQS